MNNIGINQKKAIKLNKQLNQLLANYQIFYMNTRGFHWNIKGADFFELHVKFEEQYNDLLIKVDEIAERILTLGGKPLHGYSDYLKIANIKEKKNVSNGKAAVKNLVKSFKTIIQQQRQILLIAGEADDEGTSALMSDYIREQEKLVWMYAAFLG